MHASHFDGVSQAQEQSFGRDNLFRIDREIGNPYSPPCFFLVLADYCFGKGQGCGRSVFFFFFGSQPNCWEKKSRLS